MALDLLEEHLGETGFTRGPRHAGPDGGSDAWFRGRVGQTRAAWKIACAVRAKLSTLRTKIETERKKAVRDGATGMIVVTPYDLTVAEVLRLEAGAKKGLKDVIVWGRSKLEKLLHKYPLLTADHFGRLLAPGFVPLNDPSQNDVPALPDQDMVGRDVEARAFEEFLSAPERVLLLFGRGGAGKSRFLRAMPDLIRWPPSRSRPPARSVRRSAWLRRPRVGALEEAMIDALPRGRPLLLCLDDAGYYADEAQALAQHAQVLSGIDVRVVLVARTADRALLERACREAKAPWRILEIGNISHDDKLAIVDRDGGRLPAQTRAAVTRFAGENLFLLRAAARALREGVPPSSILEEGQLRGLVVDRLIREAATHLGVSEREVAEVLLLAAIDMPLSPEAVSEEIRRSALLAAGIFRGVGNHVRFRADVEADLTIAHLARAAWGEALLRASLSSPAEGVRRRIRNLAAAGPGLPAELVANQFRIWSRAAAMTTLFDRREILKTVARSAPAAPEAAVELCEQYLVTWPAAATDPLEIAYPPPRMTSDDFGPVAQELGHAGHELQSLKLAYAFAENSLPTGQYSNYKWSGLAEAIASPAFHEPVAIERVVGEIGRFIEDPRRVTLIAPLAGAILDLLLASSFHWTSSDGATFTMHEHPFVPNEVVRAIRSQALELLRKMLGHSAREARRVGAEVFANLGRGPGRVDARIMYDLIASERAMMLPIVSERLSSETDLEIADALERAVVYLWAAKTPCADEAGKILCSLPSDPRLRAYQLVQEPWLWKPSYEEFVAVAPDEDRWTWWVQQGMKPPDEAAILKLIGQLQESIRNAVDLVHFVQSVGPARQWSLLLDPWCASNLTLFKEAALHPSASEPTREILGRAVRRADLREHPERLVSRVRELASDGASAEIVKVLEDGGPVAVEHLRLVLRDCAEARSVEVRALVFGYHFANPQLPTTERLEHAEVALRDGDWSNYWDPVWALVHPPQAFAALGARPSLVERLYERIGEALRSATDFITPTHEWHLDQLIAILERLDNHARIRLLEAALSDQTTYYLGALAGPLATDDDRLEALVDLLTRLLSDGALEDVSSVRVVLQQALRSGHLPPVALEMGRKLVSGSDGSAARVGLALLAELRTSSEACAEVCEIAADPTHPLHDEADSAALAFMSPRGVYGGAIGAVPPAFLELQRTVTAARDHARTSAGRARIQQLVDHVARSIESHQRDDEEVLDPHG